jgi:hypothetical protein
MDMLVSRRGVSGAGLRCQSVIVRHFVALSDNRLPMRVREFRRENSVCIY